ncbi:uncharacterized protein LOC116336905 [Contarinia nasturtii]|uniref:uncharacterized protein LOC116336905 n=1 Tax=Contarinia nasturtii TaxID=265458 RepID=UPI0012D3C3F1|nr:uncharacterized protein LOC116336905 [Contarinia nasturtii]
MMKIFALVLFVAFVAADTQDDDFQLPAGTITCQIDSPDRDECIKEAIQDMLPKLNNGLVGLRIPPIDPYKIESQTLNFRRGENFVATGTIRKANVHGASKAKITDVKTKITKTHISTQIKAIVPESTVEGYYRGEGRFNGLKIKSKGYFNVTATDISLVSRTEGDIIEVNGKEYVKITKFDVSPQFGDLKVFATGLFPDPELNRVTLEFVNQYWPFMVKEMMPQARATIEPLLIDEANKFLLHVPIRKMLYYGEDSA